MTVLNQCVAVIRRDVTLAFRRRSEITDPLTFFVIVVTLFPLALGPEVNMLQRIAPGVVWVAALLAAMLSLEKIFHSDYNDGTLEQLVLGSESLPLLVLAKVAAHWLTTGLPLLAVAPFLGVLLGMPADALGVLVLTLLIGTPVLSLLGAIGVALTVSQRRGGVLLSVLVLPLCIPVLIFGTTAVETAAGGLPIGGHLSLLAALLVLALTLAPWAAAAALKIALE